MLKIKNLFGGYNEGNQILKGVDLSIGKNEAIGIIGQNGAGKSTLAKAILNMIPNINGDIVFRGNNIAGNSTGDNIKSGIGFFMQGGRIFPHLTVLENLEFSGNDLPRIIFQKRYRKIILNFDSLKSGLSTQLDMQASYLSGGEKHQLALAMVLIQNPKLLILDEPSAGLSPGNVKQSYQFLNKIRKQEAISILLIEQNVHSAVEFCDKTFILQNGRVMKNIDPELSTYEWIEQSYFENY